MKLLFNFIMVLIGGNIAPIGYVLGVGFSVVGGILTVNVDETNHLIGALILCLIGGIIIFFRIRKDVIEIRNEIK